MLRVPFSILSPAGQRGRLSILIFHRVLAKADPLDPDSPSATEFAERMQWIREWFNVLPLRVAVERLFDGSLPDRALAITFDDGYADNEAVAAPILKDLGLTATFFVSTRFLHGECMWNDQIIEALRASPLDRIDLTAFELGVHPLSTLESRRTAIDTILGLIKRLEPTRRRAATDEIVRISCASDIPPMMMNPDQVRSLVNLGMDVGAHTVTHPILVSLTSAEARSEMEQGKRELEDILGRPVRLFAYPNGIPDLDYAAEHAAMAKDCGFEAAVSTAWGAASIRSDRFQLPRFTPWDRTRLRYGVRLLANLRRDEQVATR
jgi:peptidoglycan/xylan/chitin deacetylase (PgdA/CDA1 family)